MRELTGIDVTTALQAAQRVIGIKHRQKRTQGGESHPTLVLIERSGAEQQLEVPQKKRGRKTGKPKETPLLTLEDEDAELDFVYNRLPIAWRPLKEGEDVAAFDERHLKPPKQEGDPTLVPCEFEGLRKGDVVIMQLGGSGGYLQAGLARQAERVGAYVYGVPSTTLKQLRAPDATKDDDTRLMLDVARKHPEHCYIQLRQHRLSLHITEAYRQWITAQRNRIACQLQLYQRAKGTVFFNEDNLDNPGSVHSAYLGLKANDVVLANLEEIEEERHRHLNGLLERAPVYRSALSGVEGCGPSTSARIIAAVGDLRRFIVTPDPTLLSELRSERSRLVDEAEVDEWTVDELTGHQFAAQARATYEKARERGDRHQMWQIIRSNKERQAQKFREAGIVEQAQFLEAEVDLLNQALAINQRIHELKREAFFRSRGRFLSYCGVGVIKVPVYQRDDNDEIVKDEKTGDPIVASMVGIFPRRRTGSHAKWNNDARTGFYLLGDQWNRRADSEWGQRLRQNKEMYRKRHPDEIEVVENGKKRKKYTKGHIHRMAVWRTITEFAKWLFAEWYKLDIKGLPPGVETNKENAAK
ncbi:MAG: hypothetical protein UY72_C0040G0004 [Candidatus Uhrbacteria bacterium GW2011_GWD2_52_7]|uniref:Uncharacterized protein n=1 Tax=Candidatus Uhrbacteria bacterium GW2011_GWD2_52_7 TaxID=1618989 RepID=A0A0G1ZN50_9BACT|nr:MAG: hypothetical protein UY72_C0040G0004 [Candidatus Uhrbacteria bacterium GW2011_GWD2_52_7]